MEKEVRVRFAPSPTGGLHIGGVRTALYNYLFAKKHNGKMILRIEDTDQSRFVQGAEDYIFEALQWLGLELDESPRKGGPYTPYRQSERKESYKEFAQNLIDAGHAYYAFDTPEELDAMRERLKAARVVSPQYNAITRMTMKNSLTLPEDEVKKRIESGEPYVIRLKVPRKEEIRLNDLVRGWVMWHSSTLDDKVLMKSDGMPTYHLANVVDDHLMKISHVIRGEEWLPSAPCHILLYKYLGWEDSMPEFAHLPLLLKPDGNGKLSKRDAEKHGFPLFPLEWKDPATGETAQGFREDGYLPEAVINFLAFLGWNPGTHEELFTLEELIDAFSVERIGKSGTKFDINKAKWYNQQYIKDKPDRELSGYLIKALDEHNIAYTAEKAEQVCSLLKDRIVFPNDLWHDGKYFFVEPDSYNESVVKSKWTSEAVQVITEFRDVLAQKDSISAEEAKPLLMGILEKNKLKIGKVLPALRLAITGTGSGPDLMMIIEILGKNEVHARIEKALTVLSNKVKVS
ncbi:glutamate--tRNA ligase [Cytophagaceae bacterium ABcell3]|nr:glutamate--tRNA ligase [Cytophagaceae bacterium ABcell3]